MSRRRLDDMERRHVEQLGAWLASQFPSRRQLRGFMDLSTVERCACYPGKGLELLTAEHWETIGLTALHLLAEVEGDLN